MLYVFFPRSSFSDALADRWWAQVKLEIRVFREDATNCWNERRKSGGRCGLIGRARALPGTHKTPTRTRGGYDDDDDDDGSLGRYMRYNIIHTHTHTYKHCSTPYTHIIHIIHTRGSWHVPGRWSDSRHVLHVHTTWPRTPTGSRSFSVGIHTIYLWGTHLSRSSHNIILYIFLISRARARVCIYEKDGLPPPTRRSSRGLWSRFLPGGLLQSWALGDKLRIIVII